MPDTETFMQREAELRLEPRLKLYRSPAPPEPALFGNILRVKGGEHLGCCRHTGAESHLCRNKLDTWPESKEQAFPVGFTDT